jgi:hypothetical protein
MYPMVPTWLTSGASAAGGVSRSSGRALRQRGQDSEEERRLDMPTIPLWLALWFLIGELGFFWWRRRNSKPIQFSKLALSFVLAVICGPFGWIAAWIINKKKRIE